MTAEVDEMMKLVNLQRLGGDGEVEEHEQTKGRESKKTAARRLSIAVLSDRYDHRMRTADIAIDSPRQWQQ